MLYKNQLIFDEFDVYHFYNFSSILKVEQENLFVRHIKQFKTTKIDQQYIIDIELKNKIYFDIFNDFLKNMHALLVSSNIKDLGINQKIYELIFNLNLKSDILDEKNNLSTNIKNNKVGKKSSKI